MKFIACAALTFVAAGLFAAESTGHRKVTDNKLSPSATTSAGPITIEYNAPSARNRKVEGGLVSYNQVWRLGADAATTLTTDRDLTIGDLKVPKGVYTLYVQATEGAWNLVVNKQTGQWGTVYQQAQDLGRVPMKVEKLDKPVETLKITVESEGAAAATLSIEWGHTKATAPIKIG